MLLAGGEPDLSLTAKLGEVIRFYMTNTANTRVFRAALPGARIKLVGGDSGHVEHEQFIDDVVLAPSERVVIDVLFDHAGELTMQHRTPDRRYRLMSIRVGEKPAQPPLDQQFDVLRSHADMVVKRERITPYLAAKPDKTLGFIAEMDTGVPEGGGSVVYSCPMHPEIVSEKPGHCPECGMRLLAVQAPPTTHTCPMHSRSSRISPGTARGAA